MLLYDKTKGRLEELKLATPPRCSLRCPAGLDDGGLDHFRRETFGSILRNALSHLGGEVELVPGDGPADLSCEPSSAEGPAVAAVLAKGFDALDLRMLCLKTHYRKPLRFDWDALEGARAERLGWAETALRLRSRGGSLAPNPAGSAGYKKRFRDALSDDLDFAGALAAVWDALRPGALSPGSQRSLLEEGERVFGLLRDG